MTLLENVRLAIDELTDLDPPRRTWSRARSSTRWAWAAKAARCPRSSREECRSAPRSRGPWRSIPARSSWTSLLPAWIHRVGGTGPAGAGALGELGITFVVVTHELESVYAIADRCILLDREARAVIAEASRPTFATTRAILA